MKAELKRIDSDDFDVVNGEPDDISCFTTILRLTIGVEGEGGGDFFEIDVTTPQWIFENINYFSFLDKTLVISVYDYKIIKKLIGEIIGRVEGESWTSIALELSKHFRWEFDGYK